MFKNSLQTILAASILALPVVSVNQQNAQSQQPEQQNNGAATFTLINKTSRPVEAFYAAPPK